MICLPSAGHLDLDADTLSDINPSHSSQNFVLCLLRFSKVSRAYCNVELENLGIVVGQNEMIMTLKAGRSMSNAGLSRALSIREATVSVMTNRLIEKGLVARGPDPRNDRKVRISLTAEGMQMQNRIRVVYATIERNIGLALGDDAVEAFVILGKLDGVLKKRLRRYR